MEDNNFFNRPVKERKSKFQEHGPEFTAGLRTDLRNLIHHGTRLFRIRDYQSKAVLAAKTHFDDVSLDIPFPPALIVAPTGSGKSGMVAMLPYILESEKVLILSPSLVISNQIGQALGHSTESKSFFELISIGPIKKGNLEGFLEPATLIEKAANVHKHNHTNIVIVNAQKFGGQSKSSLFRTDVDEDVVTKFFMKFDTLIVDEAHHYPAKTWKAIVNYFQKLQTKDNVKKIVFLTATPFRGNRIKILPGEPTYKITRQELEGITIRKSEFENVTTDELFVPDKFEVDPTFGQGLYNKISESLRQHDSEEPGILHQAMILVRLSSEATSLAELLNRCAASYNFARAVIGTKRGDKETENFRDGKFTVAVVCKKLLEGFDNKHVSVCVILRNVQSGVLFNQFIGRCVRLSGENMTSLKAVVMSFERFNQGIMWENRDNFSVDEDSDEESDGDSDVQSDECSTPGLKINDSGDLGEDEHEDMDEN